MILSIDISDEDEEVYVLSDNVHVEIIEKIPYLITDYYVFALYSLKQFLKTANSTYIYKEADEVLTLTLDEYRLLETLFEQNIIKESTNEVDSTTDSINTNEVRG